MYTRVGPWGRGKSSGWHWWIQSLMNVTKDTCIDCWPFGVSTTCTNVCRAPHSGLSPVPIRLFLETFPVASAWLCDFRMPSAWLPSDLGDSWQLPDQFHVGSSSACDVFRTVRQLSRRFPKHLPSCPQFVSLQASCRRWRNLDRRDVLMMSTGQWRQSAEGVKKIISAYKFCSGPKSRRGKFALSRRRQNLRKCQGMKKTVIGMFPEYADMLPNHAELLSCIPHLVRVLSAP